MSSCRNHHRSALVAAIASLASILAACHPPPPANEEQRTIVDPGLGIRYIAAPGWRRFYDELRSPGGSLLTIKLLSLENAERSFLAGLPQSMIPQLEEWTKFFFITPEPPQVREVTLGERPAIEVTYPVLIRKVDPPSEVTYWVVRNGNLLYVLRMTYPPGQAAVDRPAVDEMLLTWTFTTPAEPDLGGLDAFTVTVPRDTGAGENR